MLGMYYYGKIAAKSNNLDHLIQIIHFNQTLKICSYIDLKQRSVNQTSIVSHVSLA